MWSAATILVCALSMLGRSERHFHPINLVEVAAFGVSRNAEAYVTRNPGTIHLLTSSAVFREASESRHRCGARDAVAKIASILVHEEWHLRHGSDESGAYHAQLTALAALGFNADSRVHGSVKRAMLAVMQRPPQIASTGRSWCATVELDLTLFKFTNDDRVWSVRHNRWDAREHLPAPPDLHIPARRRRDGRADARPGLVDDAARPARHLAAESAQHGEHAAARRRPRSSSSGVPSSPFSTTTPTVPCSARSIRTRSGFLDARRGVRSGTACCTSCSPGSFAPARHSGGRICCSTLERYGFLGRDLLRRLLRSACASSRATSAASICIVTETTERVIGERRMALLKDLAERNATARTTRDACVLAIETLAAKPQDVTFALAYLDDELQSCTPDAEEQLARRRPTWSRSCRSRSSNAGTHTGTARRRPQSATALRRPVPRVPRSGRRSARHRAGECARLRGGAAARRSAGAARSRQDGVLQQRQSRIPDAADAAARADRGRARHRRNERSRADALDMVHRNALRLLKLVNTLLDFSRIEAGRADASYEPTDLSQLHGRSRQHVSIGVRAAPD